MDFLSMSNIIGIKEVKQPLTLEFFVFIGQKIADVYKDDEEEQAKVIGKYFDSICCTE